MLKRVAGVVAAIIGICGVAFSLYYAVKAPSMADLLVLAARAEGIELDAGDWIERWRIACLVLGAGAAAISAAGIMLVKGRRSGFILIAVVAGCLAVLPWIAEASGVVRYAFEQGGALETAVLSALAVAAIAAYVASRTLPSNYALERARDG